jgi:hypothetical protein
MSSTTQHIQRPRQGKTRVQSRPEKRQIESVASISRSGGLDKDGDALVILYSSPVARLITDSSIDWKISELSKNTGDLFRRK